MPDLPNWARPIVGSFDGPHAVLDLDPDLESNYAKRALIVLAQWHADEVVGDQEAYEYASRLIKRLEQHGLMIVPTGISTMQAEGVNDD